VREREGQLLDELEAKELELEQLRTEIEENAARPESRDGEWGEGGRGKGSGEGGAPQVRAGGLRGLRSRTNRGS